MTNAFMSSEESEEDDDNSSTTNSKVLVKRPLSYRTKKVSDFFTKLESLAKNENKVTSLGARQTVARRTGAESKRKLPDDHSYPAWAINK